MLEMKTGIEIEAWITELEDKYCNTDISDVSTTTIEEILEMFYENGNWKVKKVEVVVDWEYLLKHLEEEYAGMDKG